MIRRVAVAAAAGGGTVSATFVTGSAGVVFGRGVYQALEVRSDDL